MTKTKAENELSLEDKENISFNKKIQNINLVIIIIYFALYYILFSFTYLFVTIETSWYVLFIVFYLTFFFAHTISWVLAIPFRIWMYKLCKKKELLTQDFYSWAFDWVKILFVTCLYTLPLLSLGAAICLHQINNNFIMAILTMVIFVFIIKIGSKYLTLWFIHGYYELKSGQNYEYWKNIANNNNIKTYPTFIIPIEHKVKWANAFAFGIKGYGFIYMSDMLLNNLNKEQFASIMAHETAHLENNDIIKRLFPLLILILFLSVIYVLIYTMENSLELITIIAAIFTISILFIFKYNLKKVHQQEFDADALAIKLLGNGTYMYEALDYLYEVNKMPKEEPKKRLHQSQFHPTLYERKKRLIGEKDNQKINQNEQ